MRIRWTPPAASKTLKIGISSSVVGPVPSPVILVFIGYGRVTGSRFAALTSQKLEKSFPESPIDEM